MSEQPEWKPISDFDPKEYGSDGMLFRKNTEHGRGSAVYGWYDDTDPRYPWRFIEDHSSRIGDQDAVETNSFSAKFPPDEFMPIASL